KEVVQSPMKEEIENEGFMDNFINTIKNELLQKEKGNAVKNEGILEAVIIDKRTGKIAYANDIERNGKTYQMPLGVVQLKQDQDILIQSYNKGIKKYFDVAVPITTIMNNQKYSYGEVHLTISQSIINKVVTVAAVKIAIIVLVSLVFGIIASILLVNIMVRPIRYLVEGVHAIGEGKYDVQIKV